MLNSSCENLQQPSVGFDGSRNEPQATEEDKNVREKRSVICDRLFINSDWFSG